MFRQTSEAWTRREKESKRTEKKIKETWDVERSFFLLFGAIWHMLFPSRRSASRLCRLY
jgi:hypothetical protein